MNVERSHNRFEWVKRNAAPSFPVASKATVKTRSEMHTQNDCAAERAYEVIYA